MKQILLSLMMAAMVLVAGKDLRVLVLTPTPVMHCESCENKIKEQLRFEKGVKKIETSLEQQTVTITYDPAKTTPDALRASLRKIGRETTVVSDQPAPTGKQKRRK